MIRADYIAQCKSCPFYVMSSSGGLSFEAGERHVRETGHERQARWAMENAFNLIEAEWESPSRSYPSGGQRRS